MASRNGVRITVAQHASFDSNSMFLWKADQTSATRWERTLLFLGWLGMRDLVPGPSLRLVGGGNSRWSRLSPEPIHLGYFLRGVPTSACPREEWNRLRDATERWEPAAGLMPKGMTIRHIAGTWGPLFPLCAGLRLQVSWVLGQVDCTEAQIF
jgi:hypothetical protein